MNGRHAAISGIGAALALAQFRIIPVCGEKREDAVGQRGQRIVTIDCVAIG